MPTTLEEINEAQSDSPQMNSSMEIKESSIIFSRSDTSHKADDDVTDLRINLELRKDLLSETSAHYHVDMDEENGLYKSEFREEEIIEQRYLDIHHCRSPSYVTLTPCHMPTVIHHEDETPIDMPAENTSLTTLIPNMLNFNQSCWVSSHEEGTLLSLPSSHQLMGSTCHFPSTISAENLEYSQPPFMMIEDPFKSSVPMISNALYHLDTNNRRIWVPESCANRGTAVADRPDRNNPSRPHSGIRLASVQEGDVFMAAEFENEDLLLQHAVNIERFPNRCWRGSNPSRAQYEKGYTVYCILLIA